MAKIVTCYFLARTSYSFSSVVFLPFSGLSHRFCDANILPQAINRLIREISASVQKNVGFVDNLKDLIISANETKYNLLELRKGHLETLEKRASNEMKLYVSNKPEDKKKSTRELFLKGISEAERKGKMLKEEQRTVKDNVTDASKQVEMWNNLEKLLECKKKCWENAQQSEEENIIHHAGTETLVL